MRQITLREKGSRDAVGLSPAELVTITEARASLAKYGKTIRDAAAFYVDHLERIRRCNVTVSQLADEVLAAKRRDGFSALYLTDLRKRLNRFADDFGSRPIASITVEEIDDWLRNLDCAPKTRTNFRANVGVMFSYAKQRRTIDSNPVEQTSAPKLTDKAPEIFTVDELTALLNTAMSVAADILPMLAIGAFAGLRDAEIKRLDWSEVNLSRGFIEVKANKAKSARRRLVRIQPILAAWLAPYAALSGPLAPNNSRKKIDWVWHAARLTRWPRPTASAGVTRLIVVLIFSTLAQVRADEGRPSVVMIQTGAKGLLLVSVLISRALDSVSFQAVDIVNHTSPSKVKLTVTDAETDEILGDFLVGLEQSNGKPTYNGFASSETRRFRTAVIASELLPACWRSISLFLRFLFAHVFPVLCLAVET